MRHLHLLMPLLAVPALAQSEADDKDDWTIRASRVYTASGDPIEGGVVRVQDGKISAVSAGAGSGELEVHSITPGMIDLAPGIDMGPISLEQSSEAVFDQSASYGIDPFSHRWQRLLESGVTTVMASAPDYNVFSGLSLAVKTGGGWTVEERLLKGDVALRAAMGAQPSSGNRPPRGSEPRNFYYRRPTTRMGVEWTFRKAYYDTLGAAKWGKTDNPVRDEILNRTLSGSLPVSVKAMATQDVRTAIFLKEEFGISSMFLTQAAEAWKEPALVKRSGVGVVFPPFAASGRLADGFVSDTYFLPLQAPRDLNGEGVAIALSAGDAREPGQRLANQAGFAMRGGLSFDAALAAVTLNPARMIGIDESVGSIEVGKHADLVLWSGTPFEPTSQIVGVLLDGKLVVDPRPATQGEGQ